jgi:hypothetical protein
MYEEPVPAGPGEPELLSSESRCEFARHGLACMHLEELHRLLSRKEIAAEDSLNGLAVDDGPRALRSDSGLGIRAWTKAGEHRVGSGDR